MTKIKQYFLSKNDKLSLFLDKKEEKSQRIASTVSASL